MGLDAEVVLFVTRLIPATLAPATARTIEILVMGFNRCSRCRREGATIDLRMAAVASPPASPRRQENSARRVPWPSNVIASAPWLLDSVHRDRQVFGSHPVVASHRAIPARLYENRDPQALTYSDLSQVYSSRREVLKGRRVLTIGTREARKARRGPWHRGTVGDDSCRTARDLPVPPGGLIADDDRLIHRDHSVDGETADAYRLPASAVAAV